VKSTRWRLIVTVASVAIFILSLFFSFALNSNFSSLEVKTVSIVDGGVKISGLLYCPDYASAWNPRPTIVLAHGIGGSKEMMSGIGLELSKRGFVALCIDLLGHGGSSGSVREGANDPSLGVLSALKYIRSQPFVNPSAVGLVGHSLGAGAIRAAFVSDSEIDASVLIAGGIGDVAADSSYGVLNSTFPKNLLVIIGKYDVLFNLTELTNNELLSPFGAKEEVIPGLLYGSFSSGTARKLVVPLTTHLFEPVDPVVVSEIVWWMQETFTSEVFVSRTNLDLTYFQRDIAVLVSLASFLIIVLLAFDHLLRKSGLNPEKVAFKVEHAVFGKWKTFMIWAVIELTLLLPMFYAGYIISFPPLVFGASIAWWALSVGTIGLILLAKLLPRFPRAKFKLKSIFQKRFDWKYMALVLCLFVFMVAVVTLSELTFNINFRIVTPVLRSFTSTSRVFAFSEFFPFFLAYFFAEGMYLHELAGMSQENIESLSSFLNCGKVAFGKVLPFITVLCVHYLPAVLFGIWLFPRFVGFILEFFWLITPIFFITTVCSWWFYRKTGNVWTGAVFNSLLIGWVASTVFPF